MRLNSMPTRRAGRSARGHGNRLNCSIFAAYFRLMDHEKVYYIPARFRRIENLHILFWLIKDLCWALNFKYMALFMIIPTMGVAIMITWQTRYIISEFIHNLAVILWITANCTWMIGEFWLGCKPDREIRPSGIFCDPFCARPARVVILLHYPRPPRRL